MPTAPNGNPIFARLFVELRKSDKYWEASDSAYRLAIDALMWARDELTDGFIPASRLLMISPAKNPRKLARELVAREIWEDAPGGWFIHDYPEYQETSASIAARSAKRSAAGRLGAAATWGSTNGRQSA